MIKNANTAPKDGSQFLGDFGYEEWFITCWDKSNSTWVYAEPVEQETHTVFSCIEFISDIGLDKSLMRWTELPEFKKAGN